jgi:hypothetical protein
MSLGLIIGVAAVLLLAVVIIVSATKSRKEKKIKFLDPLNELASREGSHISRHDIWSDSVIGIDESSNKVFVVRKTAGSESGKVIDLTEVFRCRVAEISRTSGPKEGNVKVFDRIDLVFMNKEKSKPDTVVEFYNSNTDRLTLAGELQLAEKWCVLVNRQLDAIRK